MPWVRVPEIPMYIDALLADQPLTGGLEPMLGSANLRVLTIVGFPGATTPGILDDLNRLPFSYRWSTRAIMLDKTDATKLLTKLRRQWFAKRKSIGAILKEVMTNEASTLLDTDAHNKALDADAALQETGVRSDRTAFVTATITVWDRDPNAADEKLRLVDRERHDPGQDLAHAEGAHQRLAAFHAQRFRDASRREEFHDTKADAEPAERAGELVERHSRRSLDQRAPRGHAPRLGRRGPRYRARPTDAPAPHGADLTHHP